MGTLDGRPIYKLRRQGKRGMAITVPSEFGLLLPEGIKFAFTPTATGFAYELVETATESEGLPEWVHRIRGE